ncbi:Conserved_hypothetical protein [Hexamita inflata]|uniref:Transmembrane protein n=1 Tax=Hexamita inflata TaxID=28002 RepID=A0AA86PEA1_9EUKA|nr:Conserved hypothetical protein [Hexamita inflata]
MATDFIYNKNQYINFWLPYPCDLTNYKDEHVAFAKIFVVGYQTIVPIIIFDELKSDIVRSFSMLYLSFQNSSISFGMCPGYSSVSLFQETDQEIQDILFVVDRYQFKIDAPLFVENYKQWLCFSQYFDTSDIQLQKILGVSFLRAKLIVISKINFRKTFMYFNVDINATDTKYVFKDQYIHLYQNNINEIGFNVHFNYNLEEFDKVRQQIDMLVYDHVEYKLSSQNTNDLTKHIQNRSISLTKSKYFEETKNIKFSCTNMIGGQNKTCFEIYDINMNVMYSTQLYFLDIQFHYQNRIVFQMKCEIPTESIYYTCWNYGVAVVTDSGVQIKLTNTNKCDGYEKFYNYSNVSTILQYNNKQYYQQDSFQRWVQIPQASKFNQFNYSCSELNCSAINVNSTFIFQYHVYEFDEMYAIDKVLDLRVKYDGLHLSVILLVHLIIVAVLLAFCERVRYSQHVIMDYQKVKPKKKPTIDDLLQIQLKQKLQCKKYQ